MCSVCEGAGAEVVFDSLVGRQIKCIKGEGAARERTRRGAGGSRGVTGTSRGPLEKAPPGEKRGGGGFLEPSAK